MEFAEVTMLNRIEEGYVIFKLLSREVAEFSAARGRWLHSVCQSVTQTEVLSPGPGPTDVTE